MSMKMAELKAQVKELKAQVEELTRGYERSRKDVQRYMDDYGRACRERDAALKKIASMERGSAAALRFIESSEAESEARRMRKEEGQS